MLEQASKQASEQASKPARMEKRKIDGKSKRMEGEKGERNKTKKKRDKEFRDFYPEGYTRENK